MDHLLSVKSPQWSYEKEWPLMVEVHYTIGMESLIIMNHR